MRLISKFFLISFSVCCAFAITGYYFIYKPKFTQTVLPSREAIKISSTEFLRLKNEVLPLKQFISAKNYNPRICFLADMNIASGKKRFFVYDLGVDSIISYGLVAHGSCDNAFQINANFSNKINSGCSCTGKFKVGKRYTGRYGIAFKLFGLDSSNSNAYERSIVLHSYECVPEQEIYPLPICNSRGCPMVSIKFLSELDSIISSSGKPILLNIFN
ncbi:MAG: murein L,D-transpeptidase catalytic domain-containing protein [Ginsengibacter sp.]